MSLNKTEVLKKIMELSFNWQSEGVINVGWIAESMNSAPYYVRKRVKTLIKDGYLQKAVRSGGWCEYSCEPYPPLKGYSLTEKARNTVLYSEVERNENESIAKAFGCT